MLSLDEIRNMLLRFEEANNNGELEDEGEGALKALQWVTGDADYSEMDAMLPEEEEECPDCGEVDCAGASGGDCEGADPDEDTDDEDLHDGHPIATDDVPERNPEDFQIDLKMQRE